MDQPMQPKAPPQARDPSKRVRVVLVHGTWARGFRDPVPFNADKPRWFEPGSHFSNQLLTLLREQGLSPVLEPPVFEWEGRNSLADRAEGATRLVDVLRRTAPDPCLVVAHSHGGNVAMKAIDLLTVRDHTAPARIRLITLSTPFVDLFMPAPGTWNVERIMAAAFAFLIGFALFTLRWVFPQWPWWLPYALAAVPYFVAARIYVATQDEHKAMTPATHSDCLATRLHTGNKCYLLGDSPPHILVLRGVEDEASLAIGMAAALGRLMQAIRDFLVGLYYGQFKATWVMLAVLVLVVGFTASYDTLVRAGIVTGSLPADTLRWIGLIAAVLLVVPPLLLGAIAVIARMLTGFAAGKELRWMPHLEVSVATAPDLLVMPRRDSDRGVSIVTLPRRGRQVKHIRHQIYDDPEVLVPVLPWLRYAFFDEIRAAEDARR